MNMVGHQYIGMDFELMLFRRLAQALQVKLIVFVTGENVLPIVAPLNDVLRLIFDEKPFKSRHYSPCFVVLCGTVAEQRIFIESDPFSVTSAIGSNSFIAHNDANNCAYESQQNMRQS